MRAGLAAIRAIRQHGGLLVDAIATQAIHFLQGEKGKRHLHSGSGVKIVPRIHIVIKMSKMGPVMTVAIDPGIDELVMKGVRLVENPEQGRRGMSPQEVDKEAVGPGLGEGAITRYKEQAIKDKPVHRDQK